MLIAGYLVGGETSWKCTFHLSIYLGNMPRQLPELWEEWLESRKHWSCSELFPLRGYKTVAIYSFGTRYGTEEVKDSPNIFRRHMGILEICRPTKILWEIPQAAWTFHYLLSKHHLYQGETDISADRCYQKK